MAEEKLNGDSATNNTKRKTSIKRMPDDLSEA
jgi:hypothetical protein